MPKRVTNLRKLVRKEIFANEKATTEVKHKTISYGISPSTVPYGYMMPEYIAEGDTAETRDGNRINLLSESMRMNIVGETPSSYVRIMVVETRELLAFDALAGLYNCEPVLQNPTLGVNSPFDYDVVKKVHMDKLVTLREVVNGVNPIRFIKKYLRHGKRGKRIFYDGNTGALNSGNLKTYYWIIFQSDSQFLPHPRVTGMHYLRFSDK